MNTELDIADQSAVSRQYPVTIQYRRRTSRFYSLTSAEIEMHASLGWWANFLLALFGAFSGFTLGCVVSIMQGDLLDAPLAALTYGATVSGVTALIFLILAAVSLFLQWKTKKQWEVVESTFAQSEQDS